MSDKIQLAYGWFWEFPECGSDNFEHGHAAELPEEQRIEMGISEEEAKEFVTAPSRVKCRACKFESETDLPDDAIQGEEIKEE
jgi:hypothetical protein